MFRRTTPTSSFVSYAEKLTALRFLSHRPERGAAMEEATLTIPFVLILTSLLLGLGGYARTQQRVFEVTSLSAHFLASRPALSYEEDSEQGASACHPVSQGAMIQLFSYLEEAGYNDVVQMTDELNLQACFKPSTATVVIVAESQVNNPLAQFTSAFKTVNIKQTAGYLFLNAGNGDSVGPSPQSGGPLAKVTVTSNTPTGTQTQGVAVYSQYSFGDSANGDPQDWGPPQGFEPL
jgi:hypothetical protein